MIDATKFDLTNSIIPYLDRHLVFPLLEFIYAKKIYDEKSFLKVKLEILNKTDMIDYISEIRKTIYIDEEIPEEYQIRRIGVVSRLKELKADVNPILEIMANEEVMKSMETMRDSKTLISFLTSEHNFDISMIGSLYKLAKSCYDCGNYRVTASYLYFCLLVTQPSDKVLSVEQLVIVLDSIDFDNKLLNAKPLYEKYNQLIRWSCKRISYVPERLDVIPISSVSNLNILLGERNVFSWWPRSYTLCDLLQTLDNKRTVAAAKRNLRIYANRDGIELLYGEWDRLKSNDFFALTDSKKCFYFQYTENLDSQRETLHSILQHFRNYNHDSPSIDFSAIFLPVCDWHLLKLSYHLKIELILFGSATLERNGYYWFMYCDRVYVGEVTQIYRWGVLLPSLLPSSVVIELSVPSGIRIDLYNEYPLTGLIFLQMKRNSTNFDENLVFGKILQRTLSQEIIEEKNMYETCMNMDPENSTFYFVNPNFDHLVLTVRYRNEYVLTRLISFLLKSSNPETHLFKMFFGWLSERARDYSYHDWLLKRIFYSPESNISSIISKHQINLFLNFEFTTIHCLFVSYQRWIKYNKCKYDADFELNFQLIEEIYEQLLYSGLNSVVINNKEIRSEFDSSVKQRTIIDTILDPNNSFDICKNLRLKNETDRERNSLLQTIYRLDDDKLFQSLFCYDFCRNGFIQTVDKCRLLSSTDIRNIETLTRMAIEYKSPKIIRVLIKHYSFAYLFSDRSNKYTNFVKSCDFATHIRNFYNFSYGDILTTVDFRKHLNQLVLVILYYDSHESILFSERFLQLFHELRYSHVSRQSDFDCLANIFEANFYRNFYISHPEFLRVDYLMRKFDKLKIKICTNRHCKVLLLDILRNHEILDSLRFCSDHFPEVRTLNLQQITKLIGNRFIAVYVYYFYRLFMIGIELIRKASTESFLALNYEFLDNNCLKNILFNSSCIEEFMCF